ncbi:MAG: hypothetical protein HKM24_07315 [Gammaproteobacteria bacterium]|nr:hypothetical protein [Gammaproteobacteria bacterium]
MAVSVSTRALLQPLAAIGFGQRGTRQWRRLLNEVLHTKMPDLHRLRRGASDLMMTSDLEQAAAA